MSFSHNLRCLSFLNKIFNPSFTSSQFCYFNKIPSNDTKQTQVQIRSRRMILYADTERESGGCVCVLALLQPRVSARTGGGDSTACAHRCPATRHMFAAQTCCTSSKHLHLHLCQSKNKTTHQIRLIKSSFCIESTGN